MTAELFGMIREYTHIHGRRNKVLMDAHTYGVNIHGKLLFDYHAISFTAKPLTMLRMWMFSSMFKKEVKFVWRRPEKFWNLPSSVWWILRRKRDMKTDSISSVYSKIYGDDVSSGSEAESGVRNCGSEGNRMFCNWSV